MIFTTHFLTAEEPNKNHRTYPLAVCKEVVAKLNEAPTLGHLGVTDRVDLSRVSHVVEKVWMENGKVFGQCKVLQTDMGDRLRAMLDFGAVEFAVAGSGKIDHDGVVSDFEVHSVNAVWNGEPDVK